MAGGIIIAVAAAFQEKQCSTGLSSGERVDWIAHEGRGTTLCCGTFPLLALNIDFHYNCTKQRFNHFMLEGRMGSMHDLTKSQNHILCMFM